MSEARKKLLFVSPRFLFPVDSGGKIRTTQILKLLNTPAVAPFQRLDSATPYSTLYHRQKRSRPIIPLDDLMAFSVYRAG